MSFDQLNQDWQKQFDDIPIPTESLDKQLAKALAQTELPPAKKVRKFPIKKRTIELFTRAALVILCLTGFYFIWQNSNNSASKTSSEYAEQPLGANDEAASQSESKATDQKIAYYYHISQQTTKFEQSLTAIKELTKNKGGYLDASNISEFGEVGEQQAQLTLRIPEKEKDSFLTELGEIAKITTENQASSNETSNYRDIESRLKSLAAEEEALLTLLKKAEKMDDMLKIQERLSTIRTEKETLETEKNNLDKEITYSTFELNLTEISTTKENAESPKAGNRIQSNWQKQLTFWKTLFTSLGVFIASNFVYLILIGVGIGILLYKYKKK